MCEENEMVNLIKNLLEDKEEDIHFMKNKNKELEDTNKDLLLKKLSPKIRGLRIRRSVPSNPICQLP